MEYRGYGGQLDRAERSKVVAAYARSQYLDERRRMMRRVCFAPDAEVFFHGKLMGNGGHGGSDAGVLARKLQVLVYLAHDGEACRIPW